MLGTMRSSGPTSLVASPTMLLQFLRLYFGRINEEVYPESPPKGTNPQTPPPSPSHRVDLPTQPDSSHPLHNASAPDVSDFKRQNKTALSWSYALLAISFTLLVKFPTMADYSDRFVLRAATAILEFLCFSTALGIFYYSDTSRPSAGLAKALKTVLTSSKLILLLDFLCLLALQFPFQSFLAITVASAVLAQLVLFPLHKAYISTPAALR